MKNWLKNLIRSHDSEAKVSPEELLRGKYAHFQEFLEARKKALVLLSSSPALDRPVISEQISQAIHSLSILAEGKYSDLRPKRSEAGAGDVPYEDLLARAHDLAIEQMFRLLDEYDVSKSPAKKVKTGLPINLHVIDLGGGLTAGSESKLLSREQILSLPLKAMFKGMYCPGVTWSGPIGINLKGLMVIMAQSTSRPEEDFWDKTYALVAGEYLNYNSRLGYHYSSVDAYCSDETQNNHIRFMFKGGAADDLRRALRAKFIGGVLTRIGFAVEVQKDTVNAYFRRQPRTEVEAKLDLLGRLMGCSRQRDMVMTDEAIVNWHIEAFLKGNYSFTPGE